MFKIYFKNGGSTKPYKGNVGNILFGFNNNICYGKNHFNSLLVPSNGNVLYGNIVLESE